MQTYEAKSSTSTKKWLLGCGIGCGVVIVILVALGVGGFFFVKNIVEGFKDTEAIMSTLTEKYGRIKDYCPDPEGAIRAGRMEAFLEARDIMAPIREEIGESLSTISEARRGEEIEVKTPKNVFKMLKLGFGIIPQIADFFKIRNQALLDIGMGMGEYYYIYIISYYSWLGNPVEDGPDFKLIYQEEEDYLDEEEMLEARRDRMLRRLHRMILPMLHNQYNKLIEGGSVKILDKWQDALAAEIEEMESDQYRLPWQDGLPDVIKASLQPFKEHLEASYSSMTNPLEVALEQR